MPMREPACASARPPARARVVARAGVLAMQSERVCAQAAATAPGWARQASVWVARRPPAVGWGAALAPLASCPVPAETARWSPAEPEAVELYQGLAAAWTSGSPAWCRRMIRSAAAGVLAVRVFGAALLRMSQWVRVWAGSRWRSRSRRLPWPPGFGSHRSLPCLQRAVPAR